MYPPLVRQMENWYGSTSLLRHCQIKLYGLGLVVDRGESCMMLADSKSEWEGWGGGERGVMKYHLTAGDNLLHFFFWLHPNKNIRPHWQTTHILDKKASLADSTDVFKMGFFCDQKRLHYLEVPPPPPPFCCFFHQHDSCSCRIPSYSISIG